MAYPEVVEKSAHVYKQAGVKRLLIAGLRKGWRTIARPISRAPVIDELYYQYSVYKLRGRMDSEETLDDMIETTMNFRGLGRYKSIRPLHVMNEFRELIEEVERIDPDSIIEIGTAGGGSYYIWSRYFDAEEIVAIDFSLTDKYIRFLEEFSTDAEVSFMIENSLDNQTVEMVGQELNGEVDFVFIDGAGSRDAKMADFKNYSQYLSENGIVAVHDICERPDSPRSGGDEFWQEIKQKYETREIVGPPIRTYQGQDIHLGIGIIYP